ncbi:hypothetical protein HOD08_00475 [bacterium]|nr:hypothetical protein [bacterium]
MFPSFGSIPVDILRMIKDQRDIDLQRIIKQRQNLHLNPIAKCGEKCFSQSDEDGITLEIVKRLGIKNGFFAEFGPGDGLENNTLILAASGWNGFWIGGEDLALNLKESEKFSYIKDWVTKENVVKLFKTGAKNIGAKHLDVVSLDLDGNDIYFVEELLSNGCAPKVFIVEYNAKFLPPVRFQIDYDPKHQWQRDDFFGASLCSFDDLFEKFDYSLVCCNAATGANAFFVHNEFMSLFSDVPSDIAEIYVPPNYLLYGRYGHKPSARVVEKILNR